jgi:hypothetical protein
MFIALARKKLASSGGATYQHAYAAPLGLGKLFVSERLYTYRPSGADPQNPAGLAVFSFPDSIGFCGRLEIPPMAIGGFLISTYKR